jgi:hypothetical protein
MLLVSRPFLFRLLVSFNAVGIFQFESFDYSTRAQNVGVNFVGIILQLNASTPRVHKILVSILLASFYSSTRVRKIWLPILWVEKFFLTSA